MFNLNQYLNDLIVSQDDEELKKCLDVIELDEIIYNDPWLCRQGHFGVAGAMERQLEYLGGTLLPNSEAKLTRMASSGVIGESYTQDSWFGTTNEDDPHINEEISFDQQIDDQQEFVDSLRNRMRTAAIVFVSRVRAHDELSKQLDQLSYSAIKAKAESNRQARNVTVKSRAKKAA
jgi:hypothetical protein